MASAVSSPSKSFSLRNSEGNSEGNLENGSENKSEEDISYPVMRSLVVEDLPIGTYFGKTGTFTASSWNSSSGSYVCTTSIEGISASDIAIVDLVPSSDSSTRQNQISEFSKVDMAETGDGSITLTCDSGYPSISLTIRYLVLNTR